MKIDSPSGMFGKLKGLFEKLIPFIGVAVGFFASYHICKPISSWFWSFFQDKLGLRPGAEGAFVFRDFAELLAWIPAGLIVAIVSTVIAHFLGSGGFLGYISGFLKGFAVGIMIGCLYIPFSEDIGFKWW